MLILSMIIYGMAFDFFNISGSLYVEREAEPPSGPALRASTDLITGFGAFLGSRLPGGA